MELNDIFWNSSGMIHVLNQWVQKIRVVCVLWINHMNGLRRSCIITVVCVLWINRINLLIKAIIYWLVLELWFVYCESDRMNGWEDYHISACIINCELNCMNDWEDYHILACIINVLCVLWIKSYEWIEKAIFRSELENW